VYLKRGNVRDALWCVKRKWDSGQSPCLAFRESAFRARELGFYLQLNRNFVRVF